MSVCLALLCGIWKKKKPTSLEGSRLVTVLPQASECEVTGPWAATPLPADRKPPCKALLFLLQSRSVLGEILRPPCPQLSLLPCHLSPLGGSALTPGIQRAPCPLTTALSSSFTFHIQVKQGLVR